MTVHVPFTIIMDTSFLLTMLEQHKDFHSELQNAITGPLAVTTIDKVIFELQRLARSRSSNTSALARVALEMMEEKSIEVSETMFGLDTDTTILVFALAQKNPVAVATVDRKLRAVLKRSGIPAIYPRGHRTLFLQGTRPRAA